MGVFYFPVSNLLTFSFHYYQPLFEYLQSCMNQNENFSADYRLIIATYIYKPQVSLTNSVTLTKPSDVIVIFSFSAPCRKMYDSDFDNFTSGESLGLPLPFRLLEADISIYILKVNNKFNSRTFVSSN